MKNKHAVGASRAEVRPVSSGPGGAAQDCSLFGRIPKLRASLAKS